MSIEKLEQFNKFVAGSVIGILLFLFVINIIVIVITFDPTVMGPMEFAYKLINLFFFIFYLKNMNKKLLICLASIIFIVNLFMGVLFFIVLFKIHMPFYMYAHNLILLLLMIIGPITISIESFLKIRGGRKNEDREKK